MSALLLAPSAEERSAVRSLEAVEDSEALPFIPGDVDQKDIEGMGADMRTARVEGVRAPPLVVAESGAWRSAIAHTYSTYAAANGEEDAYWGTAFHIGDGVFVTAGHNFVRHEGGTRKATTFSVNVPGRGWCETGRIVVKTPYESVQSKVADLALFRLQHGADWPDAALTPRFAAPAPPQVIVAGHVGAQRVVSMVRTRADGAISGRLSYRAQTEEGMSGGPVFSEATLFVYGAHTSWRDDLCWAVPLTRAFLNKI